MKNTNSKSKKKYQYTFIQFSVSDKQKEKIESITEQSGFTTVSDFVREAVREKILRIESPETFQQTIKVNLEQSQIREILSDVLTQLNIDPKTRDIMAELSETLIKIKKTMKTLNNYTKSDLKEKEKNIVKLLQKQGELKPKKLAELSKLSIEEIYEITSNEDKFKITMNGGITLNE